MTSTSKSQHRIVYSLLKPAVRLAAHFGVSIKILDDLVRLAYFEVLSVELKLSLAEVTHRFGQSERHVRSLARRYDSDFFDVERNVGLPREIEALVAEIPQGEDEIAEHFSSESPKQVKRAIELLHSWGRVTEGKDGLLRMTQRYAVLQSDSFPRRIDALNHFLSGVSLSVVHRLIYDNARSAMIKTIGFAAKQEDLRSFLKHFEGELRARISTIDEQAEFSGESQRYILGLNVAPEGVAPKLPDEYSPADKAD